jgi:imidazole glycerol-phosphate synthase subunit HisH
MSKKITLIDYGMGNLLNVARAFEHCGAEVRIVDDPADVMLAERLVVPGVGAFQSCIGEVNSRGFADEIRRYVGTGRPLLGICVGMQILFDASEEFGECLGLGILPGRVRAVPSTTTHGLSQRIPHIGWNHLVAPQTDRSWDGSFLSPLSGLGPAVYFVHSFAAQPALEEDRLADCMYGGHRVCAAVQRANVMATQFHPERSGEVGLKVVRHFTSI